MSRQTSSKGFAYIERQFKECKGRIELQRRIVEQVRAINADATQAEASLNILIDDQSSKLRIMAYAKMGQERFELMLDLVTMIVG
jgi:hypothetical protein